ncbi:TonB-dependent receptor plug domain-containing protein [Chryseobacterium gleum]|uniref:TonB-dependent receptor plug domain-containing protein n=1 Tax=Chryseobacterium gleum TaxID=250 RepID=UPI0028ACE014|nr:TonB-dependent receptor plug domain-containing protein [Chryseobacterium gleum]
MENNHIDQQFNEASRISEEPAVFPGFEKVWEKIEEKLDKKEEKKRIIPLWLPYGIAASLMIGLGAFYFMNKKETAEPLQPVIAENTSSSGPINKTDIAKIDRTIKENIRKEELPVTVPLPTELKSSSVEGIDPYKPHPTCNIPPLEASGRVTASLPQIYSDTLKTKEIDEVVVTAYGIKKSYKSVTTSSKITVASTDKTPVHVPATVSSLAGRVAGLEVSTGIKKHDAILIRGSRSIDGRSTAPLYIVDGIVLGRESEFLNTLDPEKIKELKVLKGNEATALYGSKANNGVIVITTKGLSEEEIKKLKKNSSDSAEKIVKKPEEPEKILPKAGQLTAGEVNDFSKWDYWKDIAVPILDQYKNTWKFFPDKRVSVQLVNRDRRPVTGEKVKLLDDKKNVVWEAVSDNLAM